MQNFMGASKKRNITTKKASETGRMGASKKRNITTKKASETGRRLPPTRA
jgi:hypothetical protein